MTEATTDERTPKTNAELKQLAMGMLTGAVFSDWMIPEEEYEGIIRSIFMPFALMTREQAEEFAKHKPHMLYEEIRNAGPRAVNGYPCFFSVNFLTEPECEKLREYLKELREVPED